MLPNMGLVPVSSIESEDPPVTDVSDFEHQVSERNTVRQARPLITSLASHVRKRWAEARDAKQDVEQRMAESLRRRRGEYDEQKLAAIREQGGSDIFLGLTSVKCRAASAWLRETLMGTGVDRPWQLDHTPIPEPPPDVLMQLQQQMQQQLQQLYMQGIQPAPDQLQQMAQEAKKQAAAQIEEQAKERVERMADKIEDQLVEGGWLAALSEFIDDLVTFPSAVLKGPVPRNRTTMKWEGNQLSPVKDIRLEWERINPFMLYPAPWSSEPDDGYLIERHRLTREDLQAMIGVDGYDEDAIKAVLNEFETGGLAEWLWVDTAQALAEGKEMDAFHTTDLIDALQLWDSVEGKLLIEWGVPPEEIEDPLLTYPCEIWLINGTVIRAVLNYDPLGRKPYFATAYEKIPGAFWGNSVVDLIRDPQDMINGCGRALANNMAISSGPQVEVNISRLPADENITQMYPWKIWQTVYTDFTDPRPALNFFQPQSNAGELLTVLDKFANLADEYSGIPKYMTGEHVAGAGRTSSGLAMLINNAAKSLKHVVSNVDYDVINPMLERIYQHNLRYNQDPDMIGDVRIVAKGAMSLVSREAAAVRRNEFLQVVLASPLAQQIVGMPGAAELLRENARLLDVNPERIVPSRDQIQQQMAAQAQQAQMMQEQQMAMQQAGDQAPRPPGQGTPPKPRSAPTQADGSRQGGRDSNFQSPRPNMR